MSEQSGEAFDAISQVLSIEKVMINVSGKEDEPLWVNPFVVDAIGIHGDGTLLVLGSGVTLVAKRKHPNEVAQQVCEGIRHQEEELDGYTTGG